MCQRTASVVYSDHHLILYAVCEYNTKNKYYGYSLVLRVNYKTRCVYNVNDNIMHARDSNH